MAERPQVLIESWFPVDVIGAESMRDASAAQKPPLNRLHVWWARRPLTTCRAAILASVLPAWSEDWPEKLKEKFPTEAGYRAWFLKACGIFGDPVAGRKLIQWAKDNNIKKLPAPPYTHKRAFTVSPSPEILDTLGDLLEHTWGSRKLSVLDPFAGGGSIPFEAMRYGFDTYANELNPVASVILKATLEYPAKFGPKLADDIRKYGDLLAKKVRERLEPFFPVQDGESIHAYLWARTVACPYTGKQIPLSPNWWLQKGADPIAVQPVFDPMADQARFEVVRGNTPCERATPDRGTTSRMGAISPWADNQAVPWDHVRAEGRASRMGQQLYALAVKRDGGLTFRPPTANDLNAAKRASEEFGQRTAGWESVGMIPTEEIPIGQETHDHQYGVTHWAKMFAPRQLLSLGTLVEALRHISDTVIEDLGPEKGQAVLTYLGMAVDKAADRNSYMSRWIPQRGVLENTFDRHDFSLKWSFGEFEGARNMCAWAFEQIADSYTGIASLASPLSSLPTGPTRKLDQNLRLSFGTAARLQSVPDVSVDTICVDPPYYDNVMYGECSDFFYVWMKRTIGRLHARLMDCELTNKDDEAVANPSRFALIGKNKKALALADYERKMAASFREMHRVLTNEGTLTVMFTHKKVEAWDTLATSLIGAGFAIHSSWPVHTEFTHSLHVAKKNSAQSTILLTCRKREPRAEAVWWDDLKGRIRSVAREKAQEFEAQGIRGVDLYIATFGPTLGILSESWPVLTSELDERTGKPKPLRPEVALDLAREEVVALRKQGLLLGRTVQFDPYTDWTLMAWDAFRAETFPGDEARKLALAMGLDLERELVAQKRLVSKKGQNVSLQKPIDRRKRDMVDPDKKSFDCWIDAAHTAMLLYQEDGAQACKAFLQQSGLMTDGTFKACLQALMNAVPRTKLKGKFVRPEAEVLEALRLSFVDDIQPPADEAPPVLKPTQAGLFDEVGMGLGDEETMGDEEETEEDEE